MNRIFSKIQIVLFLFIFSFFTFSYFSGCDDSGIVTTPNNATFSYTKLQHLDQTNDGLYEAWVIFQDTGTTFVSCGKFNIDALNGNIVDVNGNPANLRLKYKPANYSSAKYGLLTIDLPNFTDTVPTANALRILAGDIISSGDYLISNMTITHSQALGSIVQNFPNDSAKFMLDTPTDTNETQWYDGIWLDTSSTASLHGLPVLDNNFPWVYEAWIQRIGASPSITKVGRFKNAYAPDDDGPGPYHGPDSTNYYQRPGQDFLMNNPPVIDLRNSYYRLLITLEPQSLPKGLTNHFLLIFFGNSALGSRGQTGILPNALQSGTNFPTATLKVSSK